MKRVVIYILIAIALSYLVRELIYVGLRKNKMGEFDKLNTMLLKQNKYDALIIGSSRAESHFVPTIIDSITGLNSFNAGQGGAAQEQNMAILRSYLVHNTSLKVVILNVDLESLNLAADSIRDFPRYFAYFGNDTLYENIKKHDQRFIYFKWISFYSLPYMHDYYLSASIRGWLGRSNDADRSYIKGFTPELKHFDVDMDKLNYRSKHYKFSESFLKSMNEFSAVCKAHNIKLVLVITPTYYKEMQFVSNKEEVDLRLQKIADENGLVFIDCSSYELCNNKELFANPRHLNQKGAVLFSQKFAEQLRQYLH